MVFEALRRLRVVVDRAVGGFLALVATAAEGEVESLGGAVLRLGFVLMGLVLGFAVGSTALCCKVDRTSSSLSRTSKSSSWSTPCTDFNRRDWRVVPT